MRLALLVCCVAVGCGPTSDADLFGMWSNLDDGEYLVFEFAQSGDEDELTGESPIFRLYSYGEGDEAEEVQRGAYYVEEQVLVQEITWATDSAQIGQAYGNDIFRSTEKKLVLESVSAANGKRIFDAVDTLP